MRWPTERLDTVATVVRGVSFDKGEVTTEPRNGAVPILRAGNISDDLDTRSDLIWVPSARVKPEQQLRSGDIAICMSSGSQTVVGKSALLRADWMGSVGAFCAIVRPRKDRVDPAFLALYMRSAGFRAWTRRSEGINIKNIRNSELMEQYVPVPPLDEQRRLVDLLTRAENIVRMRREAEAKAKDIIPALFVDMFGDPGTSSELPRMTLSNLFPNDRDGVKCGPFGSALKKREYVETGIPVWTMKNIGDEGFRPEGSLFVTPEKASELSAYSVRRGDLLISRAGTVGRIAEVDRGPSNAILHTNLVRISLDQEKITNEYFVTLLSYFGKQVARLKRSADEAYTFLSAAELPSLVIPVPRMELQREFSSRAAQVRSLFESQGNCTATATQAFQSLLAGVFGGCA